MKKPARLQNKFTKDFITPLCCGIILSILFTVTSFIIYAGTLDQSSHLMTIFTDLDKQKSEPIILNARNVLMQKFQTSISLIYKIKQFYHHIIRHQLLNFSNDKEMRQFLNKYTYNTQILYDNYSSIQTVFEKNPLDYSGWWVNLSIRTVDQMTDPMLVKQAFSMASMNMFFRSLYEINQSSQSRGFQLAYFASPATGLFFQFPLSNSSPVKFNCLTPMPPWCKDREQSTPQYYYFYCRPWYQQAKLFKDEYGLDVIVSDQYQFIQEEIGVTVCLTTTDPLNVGANLLICLDHLVNDIIQTFDDYNNLLSGYFFLMRIHTSIPIYYPDILRRRQIENIKRFEFGMNSTFVTDDLTMYDSMIGKFNANSSDTSQGYFARNGTIWNFTLYPVLFFVSDSDPSKQQHLFSLVYLHTKEPITDALQKIQKEWYPRIGFQIAVFILLGYVLFLISRHLIIAIAISIVKPIKNIKKILEGLNNKKLSFANIISDNDILVDSDDFPQRHTEDIEDNNTKDDPNREDDDDEYIGVRSENIDDIFCLLINLKNSLTTVRDTSQKTDHDSIIKFLFAKKVFAEVQNLKAKYLCDSNVGNLLIKCQKYDKALFHLMESMKDPDKTYRNLSKSLTKSPPSIKKITLKKFSSVKSYKQKSTENNNNNNETTTNCLGNDKKNRRKMDLFKKKFLDNRYPKLLYCFKKYYKNLKRLIKSKDEALIFESGKSGVGIDIFGSASQHSLASYESFLTEYLKISYNCGDNQHILLALLEMNEFLISYRLKICKHKIFQYDSLSKRETMTKIVENFRQIDLRLPESDMINNNENVNKISNVLNILKREGEFIETIETPIYVIHQRMNYLKGKYFYICGHFSTAIGYFKISKKLTLISDATIVRSSLKKLQKIALKYIDMYDSKIIPLTNHMVSHEDRKLLKENEKYTRQKEKMLEYFNEKKVEITKFQYFEKDICIVIPFNKNTEEDRFTQAMKVAITIFETMITSDDRFAVLQYSDGFANILINLAFKSIKTFDYIKDYMENLIFNEQFLRKREDAFQEEDDDDDNDDNDNDDIDVIPDEMKNDSQLKTALMHAFNYLHKKNYYSTKIREHWYICILKALSKEDMLFFANGSYKDIIQGNPHENIILILLEKEKKNLSVIDLRIRKSLKFNKSGVFHMTQLDELKKKMKSIGRIQEDHVLPQEKYDININAHD